MRAGSCSAQRRAERRVQQVRAHAGVVLVDEAPVGAHERAVAGRRRRGVTSVAARGARRSSRTACAAASGARRRHARSWRASRIARWPYASRPPLRRIAAASASRPASELVDGDRLAARDALDQAEVGRREQADVVGVLPVDALEALGDRPAGCRPSRSASRAVLARRALAVALARDRDREAAGCAPRRAPIGCSPPRLKPVYG